VGTFSLQQIDQRVLDALDNNSQEFPQQQRYAVINQGLYRLNNLCGFSQKTIAVPGFTVANQLIYSSPTGILIPLSVDFEGQRLEPTSRKRLARRYRDFTTDTGLPREWARIGLSRFLIHPADSFGGGMLEMTGVANLTKLVQPGDTTLLEDQFIECVVLWAKARLLLKEGGKAFEDASMVFQQYFKQVKVLSIWSDLSFPSYWILQETSPGDGKGAGVEMIKAGG